MIPGDLLDVMTDILEATKEAAEEGRKLVGAAIFYHPEKSISPPFPFPLTPEGMAKVEVVITKTIEMVNPEWVIISVAGKAVLVATASVSEHDSAIIVHGETRDGEALTLIQPFWYDKDKIAFGKLIYSQDALVFPYISVSFHRVRGGAFH